MVASSQATTATTAVDRLRIRGVVRDDSSGAPLARVTVSVVGFPQQVFTDSSGRFTFFALPRGTVVVRARRFGFAPAERPVRVVPGSVTDVELRLMASPTTLSPVRTQAQLTEREQFERSPATSTVTLESGVLSTIPAVGEPDVFRAVQLLPGVVARDDFTAGLNVRGGEQDQNLVLLDGIPIYQPFHLGGVFGTFMNAMVGDLRLQAGAFPAPYGGRLSSILEVTSAEEGRRGVHGEVEGSMLAATFAMGGTVSNGRSSWKLAGRRTYADRVARAIVDREFPYAFYDAQLHASHTLRSGGTLSLTAYHGRDALREDFTQREDTLGIDGAYRVDWGNEALGVTWAQPFGSRTTLVHRASATRFSSAKDEGGGALRSANDVREWRGSGALRAERGDHVLGVGWEVSQHDVLYKETAPQLATELQRLTQRPFAAALFVDDTWRVGTRLLLRPGVRVEHVSGADWSGLSPRVAARWFVSRDVAVTASAGSTAQWVHALREEDDALQLFDRWVLSDSNIPVARATQAALGAERWLTRNRFLRVEAFGKHYGTLLERNPADDPARDGDEFRNIHGTSYGVELFLRQVEIGPRAGWISYSYAWNERRLGADHWSPAQDRRHTLNAVGTWRLASGTVLSGRLGYGSGMPYTGIDAQLVRRLADPRNNRFDRGTVERDVQSVAGERNAARLPMFTRIDLSLQRTFVRAHTTFTPVLGVINAANRHNVFAYRFDYVSVPATRESLSQLPIVPTLGLTVSW